MNAPGKGLLKVVSILYIVFGGIFALCMILSLFLGSLFVSLAGNMFGAFGGILGGLLFVVFLIPAAVDLVVGIIGVKQSGDPSKALFFIIFGFILGGLTLISLISSFSVWGLLGLVMPVLFIVGGFMNKNASQPVA
jgi:hypothetical protein